MEKRSAGWRIWLFAGFFDKKPKSIGPYKPSSSLLQVATGIPLKFVQSSSWIFCFDFNRDHCPRLPKLRHATCPEVHDYWHLPRLHSLPIGNVQWLGGCAACLCHLTTLIRLYGNDQECNGWLTKHILYVNMVAEPAESSWPWVRNSTCHGFFGSCGDFLFSRACRCFYMSSFP